MFNHLWSSLLLVISTVCSLSILTATLSGAAEVANSSESINESFNAQSAPALDEAVENRIISKQTPNLDLEQTIANSQEHPIDFILQSDLATKDTQPLDQAFALSEISLAELSHSERSAEDTTENEQANNVSQLNVSQLLEDGSQSADTPAAEIETTPEQVDTDRLDQVTSVTQLADVQPTDWAFQALQSLVERYGCIAGYPDGTYRGQSAMTRYEFAAGLNACLDRISELIAASAANLATQEDLDTLQRLQEEFAAELASLRGRVDALESRVAELEENQFSTTTILRGNAIFAVSDVFGGDGDENNLVGRYRVNLNFITSFTGRDFLLLGAYVGNGPVGELDAAEFAGRSGSFDLAGTEISGPLGIASLTQSTSEGSLSSDFAANTNNKLQSLVLAYSFPVGEDLNVALAHSLSAFQIYAPTLNPYLSDGEGGTGAISIFGENNPIYALVGGGTGIILNYTLFDALQLTAGYLADGLAVANSAEGNGLFNGGYGALAQLTWKVTDRFSIAGVYVNDYDRSGRFGFNYNGFAVTGTAVANSLGGQDFFGGERLGIDQSPTITNAYGIQFNWQPSSRFAIGGWFTTAYPRLIGEGDGNILTYALTFAFPDLGKEGNLLGLVVGAEPYLTEMGGDPQDFSVDVPMHIEAFYRHRIGDHIFITPGVIWLTAPNQDRDNDDDFIATLRTTFTF